ncbi:hypothetical protein H0H93_014705 [Arthromyces matolae]|nr:hypothetical protein H0H93_014705 [Arthromyces matolae]
MLALAAIQTGRLQRGTKALDMIQLCRAEDGHVSQVNATLRDIERTGNLELFLQNETGIEQTAILAYLSDGRRLTNTNLRELAGAQDQTIFVYNKNYLDYGLEDVLNDLRIEAQFHVPVEGKPLIYYHGQLFSINNAEDIGATPPIRPSQFAASYLRAAQIHHDYINNIVLSFHYQHEAIRIALANLDLNNLAISDTFDSISAGSKKELDKQALLIAGVTADLDLIGRVRIHNDFLSPAVRKSIEAGEKSRTLGDYVSNVKMKQVADTCTRAHGRLLHAMIDSIVEINSEDLRQKFHQTEAAVKDLMDGTNTVRAAVATKKLVDDAEACLRRSRENLDQISNCVSILDGGPVADSDRFLHDLRHYDSAHREEVQFIADTKNAFTRHCIVTLRQISVLNNNMVQVPPALAALQASFRVKNSFSHIQRLHNMMASERKRRQLYRGEFHGQLPFETRGLDDPVPTIDFSPSGNLDFAYSLQRDDINGLLRLLDDLDDYAQTNNDAVALGAVRECRTALDRLIGKMDGLETNFDRIAERSPIEADQQAYQEIFDQLQAAQDRNARQEALFQEERRTLQLDVQKLKAQLQEVTSTSSTEHELLGRLERDVHQARAQLDVEVNSRRIVEQRNNELQADVEKLRGELAQALADATEQSRIAESVRQELTQVRSDFDDVKALETRNTEKVNTLLEDQAAHLQKLEEARSRGEDLEAQIQSLQTESEEVHTALKESQEEKDRLLRAQAFEHERIIRDHLAEADGDRAVLERQFCELRAVQEQTESQLKDFRADLEIANSDAMGLREELQRVEHELREARHVERILRDDLKAGRSSQSDFEQRLEEGSRLVAQILDVAITFRNSHVKALHSAQLMVAHPSASKQSPNLTDSIFSNGLRHSIIGQHDEPSPIDPSDPASALELLRAFDHDDFLEAIAKAGSTIRKWQKQCKEYRERAKGKISFRNFAKGDLALFLPTRNSVSKPWAAFNVSFPHYFLHATGHLAEQLKTREWIVARITSITERVVDPQTNFKFVDAKDPNSNPYGLGEGVKYYMLEVEDWTQPSHNKRRVSSRKVSNETEPKDVILSSSPPALPPGPPETEVEESFVVTHPPNSALFPVRTRANSSPTARPSSLSRLLAQAAPENQLELVPQSPIKAPSPTISPAPPSPSHQVGSFPHHIPNTPSPLRPGSRASRLSTTSKFSSRLPTLSNAGASSSKAAPTTAITEQPIMSSSPNSASLDGNPFGLTSTPSPVGSISEGMANVLLNRRRTTSYHLARPSSLVNANLTASQDTPAQAQRNSLTASNTLATLASSFGVFRRKKGTEADHLSPQGAASASGKAMLGESDEIASEGPASARTWHQA